VKQVQQTQFKLVQTLSTKNSRPPFVTVHIYADDPSFMAISRILDGFMPTYKEEGQI
jgi:hypothetical protein